jgi:hypothetical protein
MGQIYEAIVDLELEPESNSTLTGEGADLSDSQTDPYSAAEFLHRALRSMELDAVDRCFLLMKFLYPLNSIQAAAFNIQSNALSSLARGLEILDNTVDIRSKRSLISLLDRRPLQEKLESLAPLMQYQPLKPSDRLRHLLELRHFLSDWGLACCFHLARTSRWSLTAEQTLMCLRHPTGFVREAVLSYLKVASQRALVELLPMLQTDPDPLVATQVKQLMTELGLEHTNSV